MLRSFMFSKSLYRKFNRDYWLFFFSYFFDFINYLDKARIYSIRNFESEIQKFGDGIQRVSTTPIVYVKTTMHNVFVYLILNGNVIFKKTCGELKGVRKKSRGHFRNVYPIANLALKKLFRLKRRFYIFYVSFVINGDMKCARSVWNVFNYYSRIQGKISKSAYRKYQRYFLKLKKLKNRFQDRFILQSHHKKKLKKLMMNYFLRNNKFFRILYVRDNTSWPFNGCRSKNRLC